MIDRHRTELRDLNKKFSMAELSLIQFADCGFHTEGCEIQLGVLRNLITSAEQFFDCGHVGGVEIDIIDANSAFDQLMLSIVFMGATAYHLNHPEGITQ